MACTSKVKGAESKAEGMGNLFVNHPYSIVACRELRDGTRLIKLHNCWPTGAWTGPWSPGSEKWKTLNILESSNEAEILSMSDRGYFWMDYKYARCPARALKNCMLVLLKLCSVVISTV